MCSIPKPLVNSNWSYSPETLNSGKIYYFLSRVTLKIDRWPWKTIKTIGHVSFVYAYWHRIIVKIKENALRNICFIRMLFVTQSWLRLGLIMPVVLTAPAKLQMQFIFDEKHKLWMNSNDKMDITTILSSDQNIYRFLKPFGVWRYSIYTMT